MDLYTADNIAKHSHQKQIHLVQSLKTVLRLLNAQQKVYFNHFIKFLLIQFFSRLNVQICRLHADIFVNPNKIEFSQDDL